MSDLVLPPLRGWAAEDCCWVVVGCGWCGSPPAGPLLLPGATASGSAQGGSSSFTGTAAT